MKIPAIAFVVPCYNEEAILQETITQLLKKRMDLIRKKLIAPESRIVLVDDGSSDCTWEKIKQAVEKERKDETVCGIRLSANRGHQNALLAGLMYAKDHADAAVSLDADLQDDIDVLDDFMREYLHGNEIVYGVRNDRSADRFFKRFSAVCYYRMLRWMGVRTIFNHADYRLMSRRALEILSEYREVNLYLRGIVPLIGLRQSIVFYKRKPAVRPTRYPLSKMLLLAWDGITSFSVRPIRIISGLGVLFLFLSFLLLIRILYVKFFGYTVDGWTSMLLAVTVFGGVQLLSLGVIGEYAAKIYMEVKQRPRFNVESILDPSDKKDSLSRESDSKECRK